jgi:quinol monooxygenase YgiN
VPVTVLATLKLKPGLAESVLAELAQQAPDTRADVGCRGVKITQNLDDPDTVIAITEWDSRADHEAYVARRVASGDLDALRGVTREPPAFTYYADRPTEAPG